MLIQLLQSKCTFKISFHHKTHKSTYSVNLSCLVQDQRLAYSFNVQIPKETGEERTEPGEERTEEGTEMGLGVRARARQCGGVD